MTGEVVQDELALPRVLLVSSWKRMSDKLLLICILEDTLRRACHRWRWDPDMTYMGWVGGNNKIEEEGV